MNYVLVKWATQSDDFYLAEVDDTKNSVSSEYNRMTQYRLVVDEDSFEKATDLAPTDIKKIPYDDFTSVVIYGLSIAMDVGCNFDEDYINELTEKHGLDPDRSFRIDFTAKHEVLVSVDDEIYLINAESENFWLDNEGQYLQDCGHEVKVLRMKKHADGELSDILEPRG